MAHLECWADTSTVGLNRLNVSFGSFELHLTCVECSSPGMRKLAAAMEDPDAIRQMTDMVNAALRVAENRVRSNQYDYILGVLLCQ